MATRRGTARNDRQSGTAAKDTLFGMAGNDVLLGLAGNDLLDGGVGVDLLQGGTGNDIYVVDTSKDRVIEKKGGGLDLVRASVSYVLPAEVEDLQLLGVGRLRGDGNAGNNRLTGNRAANLLVGNAGDDTFNGGGGADTLRGGAGNDTYVVNSAAVRVIESANAGIDLVKTSVSYTLSAHVENLNVTGNLFAHVIGNLLGNRMQGSIAVNVLDGGGGDDWLDGGAGGDTLIGGSGDDTFVVDSLDDTVVEAAAGGLDVVRTGVDGYTLAPQVEQLVLLGTSGRSATGNELANRITGTSGNDSIAGGDGDDVLDGRAGADHLTGGPGNDVYVVDNVGDVVDESAPAELLVLGFQSADGSSFENPGIVTSAAVFSTVSTWSALIDGTLDPAGRNGFGPAANRGRAISATQFDLAEGNGFSFSLTVANGAAVDLRGFSFNEQGSDGPNGQGPSDWTFTINGIPVATGFATRGNPGGHHAGELTLPNLTGVIQFEIQAQGAGAPTASWRVDDFVLMGSVGGSIDTVEASITYTLPPDVENLVLTADSAIDGTGNALANHLTGNAAANVLDGAAGSDTLSGGGGNDILVYDTADLLVDGGEGFDMLRLTGAGVTLDLTTLADTRLLNLDAIDLRGSGANTLALALSDLLALTSGGATLRVLGDADDTLSSTLQGWQIDGSPVLLEGREVQSYLATLGETQLQLLVDTALAASLS